MINFLNSSLLLEGTDAIDLKEKIAMYENATRIYRIFPTSSCVWSIKGISATDLKLRVSRADLDKEEKVDISEIDDELIKSIINKEVTTFLSYFKYFFFLTKEARLKMFEICTKTKDTNFSDRELLEVMKNAKRSNQKDGVLLVTKNNEKSHLVTGVLKKAKELSKPSGLKDEFFKWKVYQSKYRIEFCRIGKDIGEIVEWNDETNSYSVYAALKTSNDMIPVRKIKSCRYMASSKAFKHTENKPISAEDLAKICDLVEKPLVSQNLEKPKMNDIYTLLKNASLSEDKMREAEKIIDTMISTGFSEEYREA